jgi:hypothetical protein
MPGERAWKAALAEHETALAEFLARVERVPDERWQMPVAPGKWSPAEEAYHVLLAYEFGLAALREGAVMKLRVSPWQARIARWLLLPFLFSTGKFPKGAAAPREVRPPSAEAHALSRPDLVERLRRVAAEAAREVRAADAGGARLFRGAPAAPGAPLDERSHNASRASSGASGLA